MSFGGIALQPLVQYAMLRLGHPDPGPCFLDLRDDVRGNGVCAWRACCRNCGLARCTGLG